MNIHNSRGVLGTDLGNALGTVADRKTVDWVP